MFESKQFFYSNQYLTVWQLKFGCMFPPKTVFEWRRSPFPTASSFVAMFAPKTKFAEFWRRSTISKYNYYKLLLFCILKNNVWI